MSRRGTRMLMEPEVLLSTVLKVRIVFFSISKIYCLSTIDALYFLISDFNQFCSLNNNISAIKTHIRRSISPKTKTCQIKSKGLSSRGIKPMLMSQIEVKNYSHKDSNVGGVDHGENSTQDNSSTLVLKKECRLYLESDPDVERRDLVVVTVRGNQIIVELPEEDVSGVGHLRQTPEGDSIRLPEIDDYLNICVEITQKERDRIKTHQGIDLRVPEEGGDSNE